MFEYFNVISCLKKIQTKPNHVGEDFHYNTVKMCKISFVKTVTKIDHWHRREFWEIHTNTHKDLNYNEWFYLLWDRDILVSEIEN